MMKKTCKTSYEEYVGEFTDDLSGKGMCTNVNGQKYVGEFKEGLPHGKGTNIFGDGPKKGDKYTGEYKDGLRHGQGTYTCANGKVFKGTWKDGEFLGNH